MDLQSDILCSIFAKMTHYLPKTLNMRNIIRFILSLSLFIGASSFSDGEQRVDYDFYHNPIRITTSSGAIYYVKGNGEEIEICSKPDKLPAIFESQDESMDFVAKHLRYPPDDGVYRKTVIIFRVLIDEQGEIDEIRLLEGIEDCDECNEAALNAARQIKAKSPAISDGKPVKSTELILIPYGHTTNSSQNSIEPPKAVMQ